MYKNWKNLKGKNDIVISNSLRHIINSPHVPQAK